MTIAITLKVNDGVVLAADSASTLITANPDGSQAVVNVYNSANKVFNLRKGSPIGVITWGSGSIGNTSTETLIKDLRRRFTGGDPQHLDWTLDASSYEVDDVAQRLKTFMFDEHYIAAFHGWPQPPTLGFVVAGYSSGKTMAEEYKILIEHGQCTGPTAVHSIADTGLAWFGQPEAIYRLVVGFGIELPNILRTNLGVPEHQISGVIQVLQQALQAPLVVPAMPIQDAIDLAAFLVDVTINYSRFMPGAPTVGGPVELAAITKHEGFKWIRRKHYYSNTLNPEVHS